MFPLLLSLGVGFLERQAVLNALRWGLLTLGATELANQLRELEQQQQQTHTDVFHSHPQQSQNDVFQSQSQTQTQTQMEQAQQTENAQIDNQSQAQSQAQAQTSQVETQSQISQLSQLQVNGPNFEEVGDGLVNVLRSNGINTKEGLRYIGDSLKEGFRLLITLLYQSNLETNNKLSLIANYLSLIASYLRGLGLVVSTASLFGSGSSVNVDNSGVVEALREIKRSIEGLELSPNISVNPNIRVNGLEGIEEQLRGLRENSESTKRVMEKLLTPIEVNPETSLTRGDVLDILAHSLGVQAKTFADINSFEFDGDLPDLGNGIDISRIFEFFKVSSQLRGSGNSGRISAF